MDKISKFLDLVSKFSVNMFFTLTVSIGTLVYLGVNYVLSVVLGFPIGLVLYFVLLGLHAFGKLCLSLVDDKIKQVQDNWNDASVRKQVYVFFGVFFLILFVLLIVIALTLTIIL